MRLARRTGESGFQPGVELYGDGEALGSVAAVPLNRVIFSAPSRFAKSHSTWERPDLVASRSGLRMKNWISNLTETRSEFGTGLSLTSPTEKKRLGKKGPVLPKTFANDTRTLV